MKNEKQTIAELTAALKHLREVAALVPDDIWAKASDEYNLRNGWGLSSATDDYKFTMDIAKNAIQKASE